MFPIFIIIVESLNFNNCNHALPPFVIYTLLNENVKYFCAYIHNNTHVLTVFTP